MTKLSTGQRIKSSVCSTEVMVITAPDQELDLTCGGVSMGNSSGELNPARSSGTTIGKRYVNEDGSLELLCVKPGDGTLAIGDAPLKLKESKKLPKTD